MTFSQFNTAHVAQHLTHLQFLINGKNVDIRNYYQITKQIKLYVGCLWVTTEVNH